MIKIYVALNDGQSIKVNIINTGCITMSEVVIMPSLLMTTSIVSEESLARDAHTDKHTHRHTDIL